MTPIRMSLSSLREGRWYEYIIRFVLGGAATVFAGLVSSRYGASIGGLFLALPAIFCAKEAPSVTPAAAMPATTLEMTRSTDWNERSACSAKVRLRFFS